MRMPSVQSDIFRGQPVIKGYIWYLHESLSSRMQMMELDLVVGYNAASMPRKRD